MAIPNPLQKASCLRLPVLFVKRLLSPFYESELRESDAGSFLAVGWKLYISKTLPQFPPGKDFVRFRLAWVVGALLHDGRFAQCDSGMAATSLSFIDR